MKDRMRTESELACQYILHHLGAGSIPVDGVDDYDPHWTDAAFDALRSSLSFGPDSGRTNSAGGLLRPIVAGQWMTRLLQWCTNGMPHIVADNRLAASLMMTEFPQEFAGQIKMPWHAFMVTVPAGVIDGREHSVLVAQWVWGPEAIDGPPTALADGLCQVFYDAPEYDQGETGWRRARMPWGQMGGAAAKDTPGYEEWGEWILSFRDRYEQALLRYVFSACVELSSTVETTPRPHFVKGDAASAPRLWRAGPLPKCWTIRLTRPVRNDVRLYVRAYLSGRKSKIGVQYMRRGFWRNQVHGPANSLRKFIHIEPTWVGRVDAPIAVRSHVLVDKKGSAQ